MNWLIWLKRAIRVFLELEAVAPKIKEVVQTKARGPIVDLPIAVGSPEYEELKRRAIVGDLPAQPKKTVYPILSYDPADWTDDDKVNFSLFLETATGQKLMRQLRGKELAWAQYACSPACQAPDFYRATAFAASCLKGELETMSKKTETVEPFGAFSDADIDAIVNQRVNGRKNIGQ